jgi:K+-transporting ATPase KdpF subunit
MADLGAGEALTLSCEGNGMIILGAAVSVGLLVYLMMALLKPEWF